MAGATMREAIYRAEQQGLVCSVASCNNRRAGINRWCQRHLNKVRLSGHPLGRTISEKLLKPHLELAEQFVTDYHDHRGTQHAIEYLERILSEADTLSTEPPNKRTPPAKRTLYYLATLYRQSVSARTILISLLAFELHYRNDPRRYYEDRLYLVRQAMRRVLRMPRGHYAVNERTGKTYFWRPFGQWLSLPAMDLLAVGIYKALGVYLSRSVQHIRQYRLNKPVEGSWDDFVEGKQTVTDDGTLERSLNAPPNSGRAARYKQQRQALQSGEHLTAPPTASDAIASGVAPEPLPSPNVEPQGAPNVEPYGEPNAPPRKRVRGMENVRFRSFPPKDEDQF